MFVLACTCTTLCCYCRSVFFIFFSVLIHVIMLTMTPVKSLSKIPSYNKRVAILHYLVKYSTWHLFHPRDTMPAWYLLWLCVYLCVYVCLSVTSRCSVEKSGRIELVFLAQRLLLTSPSPCFKEISKVSTKYCHFPLEVCPKVWT